MGNPMEFGLAVLVGAVLALATYSIRVAMLVRTTGEADATDRASLKREAIAIFAIAVVLYVGARQLGMG